MSSSDEWLQTGIDWEAFKELPLRELLEALPVNCLQHLRLRDEEGELQVVVVLARGRPALKVNELMTKEFSPVEDVPPDKRS